uniref:Uncharacterized protein n=1 Tax=Desertifilum tharense IPPAS B-1220 TaxID=1781255 RepID=A0ACD5GYF1_9CYAN
MGNSVVSPQASGVIAIANQYGNWGDKKGVLTKNGVYQLWFAFILLTLFSLPVIAYGLAQQAELEAVLAEQRLQTLCQVPCPVPLVPLAEQGVGTIVVLAQGTTTGANLPDRPYFQLNETGDRIFYASQLYWQEPNFRPLVIVSADRDRKPRASPRNPPDSYPALKLRMCASYYYA